VGVTKLTKPCAVPLTKDAYDRPDTDGPLCSYLRKRGHQKCEWHWLTAQPVDVQVKAAGHRLVRVDGIPHRARVAAELWPAGERWCSGCQSFVPLFYTQGSQCYACSSKAKHGSMVEHTYNLPREDYERLLRWQNGRCYICRQVPRVRRLAVDHDHVTGEVRGLLCANDEWGCNSTLRRLLNSPEMAARALSYVERGPYARMRAGEPPVAALDDRTPLERRLGPYAPPRREAVMPQKIPMNWGIPETTQPARSRTGTLQAVVAQRSRSSSSSRRRELHD
jgi:hypothetical protein